MELKVKKFIEDKNKLINELYDEYGEYGFIDKLYNTYQFENMVKKCNFNTEEEQGYVNGWTDDKDELFYNILSKFQE